MSKQLLDAALQWGRNITERKKGCREHLAAFSFQTHKSQLQNLWSAACYTLSLQALSFSGLCVGVFSTS